MNKKFKVEKLKSDSNGANLFREALISAKKGPRGRYLALRDAKEYVGHHLFVIYDRKRGRNREIVAGAAVMDGLVGSIFRNYETAPKCGVRGVLPHLMNNILAVGGNRIVCQRPLLKLYEPYGFKLIATAVPPDVDDIKQPQKFYCVYESKLDEKILNKEIKTFDKYEKAYKYMSKLAGKQ